MAMIANLQYGWTLFVEPIDSEHHWGAAAIQVAFTIFVFTETWLVPVEGWFVDRYGPSVVVLFGGLMVGTAWVLNSYASSIEVLYAAAIIAGIGASAVYGTCVGNALKWFPDRRGLAAGITAAGFGAGAALTVVPIAAMIKAQGYEAAFFVFGIGQGAAIVLLSALLRKPRADTRASARRKANLIRSHVEFTPRQAVRTGVFWLMYLMFALVAAGGLMAAAQIGPIAKEFKIADVPVEIFGFVLPALTMAISLDRVFDGFGRPFFGWISDNIGRENTMAIAFAIAAAALTILAFYGSNPLVFVCVTAIFFGVFGEIYSLFPATCADTFGSKFATTNSGMLYTAKGSAAILVPFASLMAADYGWSAVFATAVCANLLAAFLALFALKPLRRHFIEGRGAVYASETAMIQLAE
jgi:OFA family oxalate/formate antiporter-like MFS transporter